MNLVSCERCGAVIDTDRIIKESVWHHDTGERIIANSLWDGDDYVPAIVCPSCDEKISYYTGNL